MKWRSSVLALALVVPAAPVVAQDARLYPLVGAAQLSPDGQRLKPLAKTSEQVRQQYEEIEIMARLLDRGLAKASGGVRATAVRALAFSPDGKTLAGMVGGGGGGMMGGSGGGGMMGGGMMGSGGVLMWDAATGKQVGPHALTDLGGAQGVYLKGQGVVYTLTLPQHFQKAVGGADKPAAKELTEWERVRKELRGEKVEANKAKGREDVSLADAVLRVLMDNGKNLTLLPDRESVTVAITLKSQSCVQCHGDPFGAAPRGSGMMPSGGGGGQSPIGGSGAGGQPGGLPPGTGGTTGATGGGNRATAQDDARSEFRKQAMLGDLAMKQNDYNRAAERYLQAVREFERQPRDAAGDLEAVEVATKLARALLAQGKTKEAESIVQAIVKLTERLKGGDRPAKPAAASEVPLPAKLVITVPKALLDQVSQGKMTFDEFRKAASVEHLTFDKPAAEKKADAGKQ